MSIRILLDSNDRRSSPNDFVKGKYTDSQKLSSLGVWLYSGLCWIISVCPSRSACYPASPCPLSQEPALSVTLTGSDNFWLPVGMANRKCQHKLGGREQREARVFIFLNLSLQGQPRLAISLNPRSLSVSRRPSLHDPCQ